MAAIDFGVYGAPESFLIDAQGVIRYKKVLKQGEALVENDELLAEVKKIK